ncbi:MAG: hypothetical protein E7653_08070 [Ruminococcaceae bacterium]|nr:hypothetical protein [Oscillospiraceae bacterium]
MEQNMTTVFFSLLSSVDKDQGFRKKQELPIEYIDELFELAKKHDLAHVLAYALYESGAVVKGDALYERVQKEQIQAIWRYEQTQLVLDELRALLESERVVFVPLKGSVIRCFYAEPWLRTSCDIDILVHEEDLDRVDELLSERGFERKGKNYHDVSYFSPSGIHLELHYNITEQISSIDRVLCKVWEYCIPLEGKQYEHRQTTEFLMYHLLAHMSYHFISGGCGIRPFLDIWLLKNKLEYDEQKLALLCREAELDTFQKNVYSLIDVWLEGKSHTALTLSMESFIFGGGVYGTMSNRIILEQAQSGGRVKHLMYRLFLPYAVIKKRYPVLEKHKYLLPVFWVVRWVQTLTSGRFKDSVIELEANNNNSDDDIKNAERFLAAVGLNPKNRG